MDFSQIAILLVTASVFGIIARLFKQPLLVGYLFAGLALKLTGLIHNFETVEGLGQIGVTLLLFLLGLEMNLKELPSVGKVALFTGLGQIFFTSLIGFGMALLFGFTTIASLYIAVALTFSSTIIMVKLLSERKDLSSLHGRIAIGFLLVQDFVAIVILMFLSGLGAGGTSVAQYGFIALKALALFILVWALSKKVLPTFFEKIIAPSNELLFIVSISWALGVAWFVTGPMGFTLEIGGFLAGLALSNLPEHLEIASRTRPVRDFFLTIFFLLLGTQLAVTQNIAPLILPAIVFSLFVLIGNPIIVMAILGFMGYKRRTSFLAGLTVAQISEFSFILMAMGASLAQVDNSHVALVILVGVITMTTSTYLILNADAVFMRIKGKLGIFERAKTHEKAILQTVTKDDHIVLVGCDRTGRSLVSYFSRNNKPFVVVDFNPSVFAKLTADNHSVVFGDINDPEILEAAGVAHARLVISTTSNLDSNLILLDYVRSTKSHTNTVFTAATKTDALRLYERGATYVVVPDVIAGDHIRQLLKIYGTRGSKLPKVGKTHFERLIFS